MVRLQRRGKFSISQIAPAVWNFSSSSSLMVLGVLLVTAFDIRSQPLSFNTIAGYAGQGSLDGPATNAQFNFPGGVAADSAGNFYVADTANHTIRKISSGGSVSTLAGLAGVSGSADSPGARFNQPQGLAVDLSGNVYVADSGNHTIRQITPGGVVTTLAGLAGNPGTNNAVGSSARFYEPEGIAVNAASSLLYVGDTWNHTIRQITLAGVVTTFAGAPGNAGTNDGIGSSAQFNQPRGIAVDGAGNVYVGDTGNQTVRKITAAGLVTTLAGSPTNYGAANGTGANARFWDPQGIALDTATNLYVADSINNTIRMITSAGVVTTLAGTAGTFGSRDGAGAGARFWQPQGIAVNGVGNIYVADSGNGTIRQIASGAMVTTLAGSSSIGSADGPGSSSRFFGPAGAALDNSGNSYVADTGNGTIRMVSSTGLVSTLAGSAGNFGSTDATGSSARFYGPQAIAMDSSAHLFYVTDTANHTIRKITPGGVVSTLAGSAGNSGLTDGTGGNARFNAPEGLALDTSGNVYVADTWNHTIRKVTSAGAVTTLAGLPGCYGDLDSAADGAGTNNARFYCPSGVAVDASGNVYVADTRNHTIRQVTPAGVVRTLAGLAGVWGNSDGTNGNARFYEPEGVSVDSSGNLYVLDSGNHTLRKVTPAGTNWVVSTIAGLPCLSGSADGVGTNAQFFFPAGLGINNANSFAVADWGNNTIRSGAVSLTGILPPVITNSPQDLTVDQGNDASFNVGASGTPPLVYQWLFNGGPIPNANSSAYTRPNAQPSDAGSYSAVVSNSAGSVTSSPAMLTVNPVSAPPSITTQPQPQTVSQSSNATFTVAASGSTPFYYQWRFFGTNLAAANGSSYTVPNAQPPNAGPYSVVVSNAYNMVTSAPAMLTVVQPPIISVQPISQLASVSNNVTFTVGLSQGTTPAYQWRKNGVPISGATLSSLSFQALVWSNAGTYSVVVNNSAGSQTSAGAVLTVQQAVFTFSDGFESYQTGGVDKNTTGGPNSAAANPWWALSTTNPQGWVTNSNVGVLPHGGSQMLSATGSLRQDYLNLLYRMNAGQVYYGNFMCEWWFYDPYGFSASGATNSQDYLALCEDVPVSTTSDTSSSFTAVNQRMSLGAYNGSVGYNYSNYQARIIGGAGSFGSQNSWYNTATPRSIGWHHARIIVGIPNATNAAPISMYIDNLTNSTVTSSTAGTNGFNLIEINHSMSAPGYAWYYDDLTFRAANDPWIIEQPVSRTVNPGDPASFATVAVGTAYQWQFNGTNVNGATTSTYTISSASPASAGSYACLITGANGTIATGSASLSLTGLPAQPGHFDSLNLIGGGALQLNMSGTPYTNYILEFTTNWTSWSTSSTLSAPSGIFQFSDPSVSSNAERFYRLRLAP